MNRNDSPMPPAMIWAVIGYLTMHHPYTRPDRMVAITMMKFLIALLIYRCEYCRRP